MGMIIGLMTVAVALLVPSFAGAQTTGASMAFGDFAQLTVTPIIGPPFQITHGPTPVASGVAPPPYAVTDLDGPITVAPPDDESYLETGAMSVSASSDVPNSDTASSEATINDFAFTASPLLTIHAASVRTTADIDGTCFSGLTATGTTTFSLPILGGSEADGLSISIHPPPNTVLFDAFGLRIVLNEQIRTGNGITGRGIIVNAIHVSFVHHFILGLTKVNGELVVAHSEASIACGLAPTPTPTPVVTPTPSPSPSPSASPTPAPTPTPTLTPTPGVTSTPTPSPSPSPSPTPVVTASPSPSPSPSPIVTPTPSPIITPTPTPVVTSTPTPVVTPTPVISPTASPTPAVTATPVVTPTPGFTPTPTPSITPIPPVTPTPTVAPLTPTPTAKPTPAPQSGENTYTDELGLSEDRLAGSTLNPGRTGQLLFGLLYDVRDAAIEASEVDPQQVNIRIANTRLPGFETGGVLARVRFRESKTSQEVLSFDIALACGQTWTGAVFLDGAVPAIRATQPIVSSVDSSTVTTEPLLDPSNGGAAEPFSIPAGVTAEDVQRGYIEVIAAERLPCEPDQGSVSLDGNTYARLGGEDATPLNTLGGDVFVIQPLSGAVFQYDMTAISRFVIAGAGSIWAPPASGRPNIGSCIGYNAGTDDEYTGFPACLNQVDFTLSKSRLHPKFDVDPLSGGETFVVITLPTKHDHCALGDTTASPPFTCAAAGERIGCGVLDALGNDLQPRPECNLPRELSILQIGNPADRSPLADELIDVGGFLSGQVAIDLIDGVHQHVGLNPNLIDLLGIGQRGFRGLPALALTIQQLVPDEVTGIHTTAVEPWSELELVPLESHPRPIGPRPTRPR